MPLVVTTEIDKGYRAALSEIKKLARGRPHVAVGFQGATGRSVHKGSGVATIAEVATFNEFGTKNIPQRSFMRTTMDENQPDLVSLNRKLYFQIARGRMTTERSLQILGIKIKSLMQKKITDLRIPPNAPSTIRRKGSSNPLIDTGQMRQSVTWQTSFGRAR